MHSHEPVMPWSLGPDYPQWTDQLRDGSRVQVRPVRKEDADREKAFIESLSPAARRFRFLGQIAHPGKDLIASLTDIDYRDDVAFAAIDPADAGGSFIGISRYSTTGDGSSCECAVTVSDAWHHRGLGTVLMKHLIEVARARGILNMYSIDSAVNSDMAELAKFLGFTRRAEHDDATLVVHSLWLGT